jgi:hypothetical protein
MGGKIIRYILHILNALKIITYRTLNTERIEKNFGINDLILIKFVFNEKIKEYP